MSHPLPQDHAYTWEAYLRLEQNSEERYEYHDGWMIALNDESNLHNHLVGNLITVLHPVVREVGGKLYSQTVKLFRHRSDRYLYPDLMVTCSPLDLQTQNGVRSPQLVVEVLSPRSAHGDQTFKLREYFKLPSLRHYLVVAQEMCLVQHFYREADEDWRFRLYDDFEQTIALPAWDLDLPLREIYADVNVDPAPDQVAEPLPTYPDAE